MSRNFQQDESTPIAKSVTVPEISFGNGSNLGALHDSFVMIMDGAWRMDFWPAATAWVVRDTNGIF